jgi:hypothetical protein
MPGGASVDYVTPVQFIQGLKPTNGKVVVADWTDWTANGYNYTGLIDLETNKVYSSYAAATAAGARRLWRCWLKAYADIVIPYLESSAFATQAGRQQALEDWYNLQESFGETSEPDGNQSTYLLPAACLGIGLALDGTSKIYRPEDQNEDARYFQYAIVTKDDKTQAWSDNDLVYVKSAKTGVGVTATKTVISGAPAFRVYASAANVGWAQIKTMNGNLQGYEAARPIEGAALAKIAQHGEAISGFLQQNAVVVDPYGCIGGSFAQTVLGLQGAQELLMFYDSVGGTDEYVQYGDSFAIFVQFRPIDSRSQWEYVYSEGAGANVYVLTETRWIVSVAVPSILPHNAFVINGFPQQSSMAKYTYGVRSVAHHALCVPLSAGVTFRSGTGTSEPCPSLSSYTYKIAYISNESSAKPSTFADPINSASNINATYPMLGVRLVIDPAANAPVEYQSALHTPSPIATNAIYKFPTAQVNGATYAKIGDTRSLVTRGDASQLQVYANGTDTLWSRRVDQLSANGFSLVRYMLQGGPDPYVVSIRATFISPETYNVSYEYKAITEEFTLPTIRSESYVQGDTTYTRVTVGYVGSLPAILQSSDIFPYWIKLRYTYSDESEEIEYIQWGEERSAVEVDRAPWLYDIMPGKYPVLGTENASSISTVYHKGRPITLAENVDQPTWSSGNMQVAVARENYANDPLKPAIRVTVTNAGTVWPSFPGGWEPWYCLVEILIGGDCYKELGGAMDAAFWLSGYSKQYSSSTFHRLFPTKQWPGQTDQHTWHVPDSGKIKIRVIMHCNYVSRKLPTGVSLEERLFELDIPEPL